MVPRKFSRSALEIHGCFPCIYIYIIFHVNLLGNTHGCKFLEVKHQKDCQAKADRTGTWIWYFAAHGSSRKNHGVRITAWRRVDRPSRAGKYLEDHPRDPKKTGWDPWDLLTRVANQLRTGMILQVEVWFTALVQNWGTPKTTLRNNSVSSLKGSLGTGTPPFHENNMVLWLWKQENVAPDNKQLPVDPMV